MNLIDITLKIVLGFSLLLITTKLLGKTQLSQINPFDFISALVLGELLGNAIYDNNIPLIYIFFTISLWGLLIFSSQVITQKFKKSRILLEGNPAIIIDNGKINRKQLKSNKLDINNLQQLLRQENVFSVREVKYAILETNGELSVLRKTNFQSPNKSDLNLPENNVYLPVTLISDGEILQDNLKKAGYNIEWLQNKLRKHNISNFKDVFYAEWLENEGLYIEKYE